LKREQKIFIISEEKGKSKKNETETYEKGTETEYFEQKRNILNGNDKENRGANSNRNGKEILKETNKPSQAHIRHSTPS
jgi:hypothetical protein